MLELYTKVDSTPIGLSSLLTIRPNLLGIYSWKKC